MKNIVILLTFTMMAYVGNAQASWEFKAYEGTMGKDMNIKLVLGQKNGQLLGFYHRDAAKTDIDLVGMVNPDGSLKLTEINERGDKMSSFVGKVQNGVFKGNWVVLNSKVSIPFSLNAKASTDKVKEFKKGHFVFVKSLNKQLEKPMINVNVDYVMLVGSTPNGTYEKLNASARTRARKKFRAAVDNIRKGNSVGTYTHNIESVFANDRVLSYAVQMKEQVGAQSVKHDAEGVNVDMQTQGKVELSDVFNVNGDYLSTLSDLCSTALEYDYASVGFDKSNLKPVVSNFENFSVTKDGIQFIFNSSQLNLPSSKSTDNPMVSVHFSKLNGLLVENGVLTEMVKSM